MSEIWKPIPGFNKYEASSLGRIRHMARKNPLKTTLDCNGYLRLPIYSSIDQKNRSRKVHRLVTAAFLGPANGLHVGHINGVRTDNRIENLKYCTAKENAKDKIAHGTGPIGERSPTSKLNSQKVLEIRQRYVGGVKGQSNVAKLAKEYGVAENTIIKVAKRESWRHIL